MKQIVASRTVDIPKDITLEVKARKVRVKGPRGAHYAEDEWRDVEGVSKARACPDSAERRAAALAA